MPLYEKIETIQIDGFAPGMWRNSVIISADFDIGFGDKPSKFVINVINTTGSYVNEEPNLSYLNPHDIQYGPFRFRFYLESFQFRIRWGICFFKFGENCVCGVYMCFKINDNN